jgi:hypothetical protein
MVISNDFIFLQFLTFSYKVLKTEKVITGGGGGEKNYRWHRVEEEKEEKTCADSPNVVASPSRQRPQRRQLFYAHGQTKLFF